LRPSAPLPVVASRVTPWLMSVPALVMNIFVPLITQPPSARRAVVAIPAASEPASGSVSPNAPIASPFASGVSQRRFCSSVPYASSGSVPMVECAFHEEATDWSAAPSSSITAT
jgi:hypothetical protein